MPFVLSISHPTEDGTGIPVAHSTHDTLGEAMQAAEAIQPAEDGWDETPAGDSWLRSPFVIHRTV